MCKCIKECNKCFKQFDISFDDEEKNTQYAFIINV